MPAGRYRFIPFLRTKSQKRQTKNRSSEKSQKKTDRTNIIAKLRLRAINQLWRPSNEGSLYQHLGTGTEHIPLVGKSADHNGYPFTNTQALDHYNELLELNNSAESVVCTLSPFFK